MRSPMRRRAASGFSMIEVLIALVVLAVGLLGLALLQTTNLRYTKSAQQRTQAVNLASELLDSMRANRSEISAYVMNAASFSAVIVPTDGCAMQATLSSANNVTRWKCEVKEALGPQATADVTVDANNLVTVNVSWNETNLPTIPGGSQIELETQL